MVSHLRRRRRAAMRSARRLWTGGHEDGDEARELREAADAKDKLDAVIGEFKQANTRRG